MKIAERIHGKLQEYDKIASEGEFASDWGDSISTILESYIRECVESDTNPTFRGLEKKLDSEFQAMNGSR